MFSVCLFKNNKTDEQNFYCPEIIFPNFRQQNQRGLKDNFKHQGRRKQLIDQLRQMPDLNEDVLGAMSQIPRHLFMDSSFEDFAYQNKAFPIAAEQTISHPYTVAFQSSLIPATKGERVLEIGTGSGYQTAVLCKLGFEVYSIERQSVLFKKTQKLLPKLGFYPRHLGFGDGYKGLAEKAPFKSIIVTAGAPYVPKELLAQLEIGGRLIIPVGDGDQKMYVFDRKSEQEFEKRELGEFKFVPMLKNKA